MTSTNRQSLMVQVPLAVRRRPGRKMVVTLEGASSPAVPSDQTHAGPALVKALARAFRYQPLLDEGRYASIIEMATAERIERGNLGTLLRLTLLSPEIVEAVLDGTYRAGGMPQMLKPFSAEWGAQADRFEGG